MEPLKAPSRKYDCMLTFQKIFWCCFWWEERIMMSNTGRLYKFNDSLDFFFEFDGRYFETDIRKESMLLIREAYAKWLLERELGRV